MKFRVDDEEESAPTGRIPNLSNTGLASATSLSASPSSTILSPSEPLKSSPSKSSSYSKKRAIIERNQFLEAVKVSSVSDPSKDVIFKLESEAWVCFL